ncbi:MAG: cadherin domain-containing protein, partial [Rhizobiaceae bacterium]|nr:cadherin domain-containing protein [Rhizobiaceae bacterium]
VMVGYTDGNGTFEGPITSAQTAAVANVNDAPVGLPTISGTVTEDQVLTADTSGISDIDGLGTFSYQWLRGGSTISGATALTYTLGDADVGTLISVSVSYTDGEGTGEGPLTSTQTAAIVNVNDTPAGVPTVTGTVAEDQTLTADTSGISDIDGLGSFSYQWLRDGGAIAGADESTYTLEVSDIGGLISVQVSYTDGNGTSEGPLNSTQTTAVTATNDAPTFSAGTGIVLTSVDGGNSYTQDVILQTDGKIITAGYTSSTLVLTRHNVDGTLDTSFGGGDGIVSSDFFPSFEFGYAVTLQSDGKILVAGRVASDFLVVRYNTDGTVDTSFGGGDGIVTTDFNGGVDFANDIIVQPDGRIIVAGRMNNGSNYDFAVVRYLSDGSLDTSFSGDGKMNLHINGSDSAEAIALQSDGKILIAGNTSNSSIGFSIVRLNSDGTFDTSFSGDGIANANISGGQDLVYGMTIQSDGKILLSGYATNKFALVRFNSDGSLDTSFSGDGKLTTTIQNTSVANDVKVQSDGKILVTGYSHNGSNYDFVLTRYNSDGSLDTSFGGGDGIVITNINGDKNQARSLSIQSDGKIIVAGEVRTNGTRDFGLVRYNTDGTLDTTFGPANTLNDTVSFIEDGAAVILDNDVTISDEELDALNSSNGNYDGSSLTLSRNGGASGEDVFSFNDGNGITLSGSNLIKSGQIIASFDITSVSGQLVITFTDANGETPTTANINNIMRQITYSNTNNSPPGSVQIDWEFNDGNSGSQGSGGAKTDTGNTTIDITETNDAAVGVPTITGTVTEDQTLTADISGITDADGLGTFLYQWLRDGSSISGATTSIYTLGDTDVGTLISVMVGYTDGNGTFEGPITSAQTAAVANVNDAPVGLPTISGTVTEDQVLTADTSGISDIDGLGTFSYQWLRDGSVISGATALTYTLGDADVGTLISVSVSYTDGEGTDEGPITSTQTAAIVNVNDTPAGVPTITGTIAEDQTLTADTSGISDADGLGTFSYQWLRDGSAISGATGSTYTLGDTDVGTLISVRVSYTDGESTNEGPLTSVQTTAVANINDAPVGLPTITGTVTENQTLTADASGISDADGLGAFSYQWLRNGITISGATTSSYTLGDADVGTLISVSVNYTDGEGTNEGPITSLQTAAIANINDTPVGLPSIIGTPTEDQTLTADTSGITDADGLGTFSYQWLRNGSVLSGATASTYTLGDDDVGTLISLRVSYTDGEGTSEGPLTSAQTAAIANINDAPVITSNGGVSAASSTIQEGNTFVITIVSTDIDGGTPIYNINGGSEASLFSIDPATGDLSFKAAPDFDTPKDIGGINQYRVIVQVSDGNGGTDTQTITIEVTSNNETTISLPDPDTPQDPKPEIDLEPDQVDPNEDILLPKGNPFEIDELLDIDQPKPESAPKDNSAEDEQQLENNEGKDSIENIPSEFWPETQVDQIIESTPKIEAVFNLNLQKIDRAALAMAMDKSLSDLQEKDHILGLTPMKLSLSMGSMLTAGFVSWALRGGTLLSALLTTMPTWKGFDPLIVLVSDRSKEEEDETDEDDLSKVETIFQNASKAHNNLRDQS